MPLSPLLAAGIAGALRWWGHHRAAALLMTGYSCFLRSGEMLGLKRRDVKIFPERSTAILALRGTKTGQRGGHTELAVVRSAAAVRLLQSHVAALDPDEDILGLSRGELCRLFRRAVAALGLADKKVTLYSFRRGGATADFFAHGSKEKTLLRGRWASARSARIYVQDAVAALADCQLSAAQENAARSLASHLFC